MLNEPGRRPTVAIVGGGASGTLAAAGLLRAGADVDVVVIEPRPLLGRGIAYSTADQSHRLNVPAAGMSLRPGDPDHFIRWAWARGEPVEAFSFPSRTLYGGYLASTLEAAAAAGPGAVTHVRDRASSIRPHGAGWEITLADAGAFAVDAVVLAVGHAPPRLPAGIPPELADDPRYVPDPWQEGALAVRPVGGRILLVGTGLTAVDVALTLAGRDPHAHFSAISRHGLRPLSHRPGGVPDNPPATAAVRPHTALGLLRSVRSEAALAAGGGGDWRDVVNGLRPVTNELWRALPLTERHRFVHRLSRFWEVHRHRLAPPVAALTAALEAAQRLEFMAARMRSVEAGPDTVRVRLDLPGGDTRALEAGLVVNCAGLAANVGGHPLLRRMAADGLCVPGPMGLGIAATEHGEVLDRAGRPTGMFTLGPLRRGELWETTAIPEIRDQAFGVAEQLTQMLDPLGMAAGSRRLA